MVHYVFNNNKPLAKGKNKHIFLIHYCPHCNTEIIGEWLEIGWLKNETFEERKIKMDSQLKEILNFANTKSCHLCGGKFDNNSEHHFSNCFIQKNSYISWPYYSCGEEKGGVKNFYCVPAEERKVSYNTLITDSAHKLQRGEKVLTQNGVATIIENFPDSTEMRVQYYEPNNIASILSFLEYFRSNERNKTTDDKIDAFINKCISKNQNSSTKGIPIKEDFDLKRYLEQLLLIEKNIFSISKRLRELYFLNYETEKEAFASEKLLFLKDKNNVDKALENYKAVKSRKIDKEITIDDFSIDYPEEPKKPKKPKAPVLAKPGFFNKKRVLAENALLTEEYEKALEMYNRDNEKYKADLKRRKETIASLEVQREERYKSAIENAKESLEKEIVEAEEKYEDLLKKYREEETTAKDIPTPEKAKHHLLKDEIKTAEELLKKFYKAQSQMFSYGILFEKYRNFVAVSSFYEYIASGRCETLEGPNGAYNLFENEIRMNMVICQLNQVLESLEQIKQNQYMIYSAIQESNRLLSSLNSSTSRVISALGEIKSRAASMESYMSKIADNTEVIAYNTERTAFYAKKNTELTNALGFMIALN